MAVHQTEQSMNGTVDSEKAKGRRRVSICGAK